MSNDNKVFGSAEVAAQLQISPTALRMWLMRNAELKPQGRFSGNDLLWSQEDIERVKLARAAKRTKVK